MIPTSFKYKWDLNLDPLFNDKIFYQLSQLEVIIIHTQKKKKKKPFIFFNE